MQGGRILFVALALSAFVVLALGKSITDSDEVRQASKDAFKRGLEFFGGGIKKEQAERAREIEIAPKRTYSQYTAGIESLSGGKPAIIEQYRKHHYLPLAPSVLPPSYPKGPDGKLNAKQMADLIKPRGPYQPGTDRVFIP